MDKQLIEAILEEPKERRDAAEHRKRILAAARALFSAQGVDATSMTEIARAANIGQGTLYRRFAHKGELCEALLKENMILFQKTMEERFAADHTSTSLERLELLFESMIRFNEENYPLLAAMIDSANGQRRGEFFQSPYYVWIHGTIVALLERGIAAGEIHALDVELTAHMMIAALKGTLYYHQKQHSYTAEQIHRTMRALLIDGLRARP